MRGIVSRSQLILLLFSALFPGPDLRGSENEDSLLIRVRQQHGDKFGYIDTHGKLVIGFQFDWAARFSEGFAKVELNSKCGYIDRSGKLAIPYRRCYGFGDFHGGFAVVSFSRRGKRYFMDLRGRLLPGAAFAFADDFSEGLAAVRPRDGGNCCWGYIGKDGKFVIAPKYEDYAGRFSEGVAGVRLNGKVGFINEQGKFVLPARFEQTESFSGGLAPVRLNGRWGYIDHDGKFAIPAQFEYARSFSDGLAAVCIEHDKCGFIDRQGNWMAEPKYRQSYPFVGGYAEVVNGLVGYIDTSGQEVLPVKYSEGSYVGEGWFNLLTFRAGGIAEWVIMNLQGKVLYRWDETDRHGPF